METDWDARVNTFRAELENLLETYNVELHADSYDGSFDLFDTLGKERAYNFTFVRGNYYRG